MNYTITIFTENKPGVLYRIAGIFLRRKINIDSLTVSEMIEKGLSRFTIVLTTDESTISKLVAQILNVIEVRFAEAHTDEDIFFHEITLIKIATPTGKDDSLQPLLTKHTAKIAYFTPESIIIEKAGTEDEVKELIAELKGFTIQDIAISGRVAMNK